MVSIDRSPAWNMFAVFGMDSLVSPTHWYFFFSGQSVNIKVSPVPKYDKWFEDWDRLSFQYVEQNAPKIWNEIWHIN